MRKFFLWSLTLGLSTLVIFSQTAVSQSTMFTFQGRLSDQGTTATGTYQMRFELYDEVLGGTQIGTTVSDVSVSVVQGLFATQLDFGPNAFTGGDRFLEIAVRREAGDPYTILSPRQQLGSAPYAIKSLSADVADLALDSEKLGGIVANEYVTNSTLETNFIRNQTTTQDNSNFNVSGNGVVGGRLAVGTSNLSATLNISSSTATAGNNTAFFAAPSIGPNASNIHFGTTGDWYIRSAAAAGKLVLQDTGGNVGIGMANPTNRLDVFGGIRSSFNASTGILAETTGGTDSWARFIMATASRRWVIGTSRDFNGNQFYLVDDTNGQVRMTVQPNGGSITFPLGSVGIGTGSPSGGLDIVRNWDGQVGTLTLRGERPTIRFSGTNSGGQHWLIHQANTTGNLDYYNSTTPGTWGSAKFSFLPNGTVRAGILQVTGGSDLAENFAVSDKSVKPGMVVAIDPTNPNELVLARGTYNRRVAGIISGANGLSAGMILPDLNDSENALPVALSGRVWVYADASKHPIIPGDLLTTSDTPGHAMKVRDHKKAQGAIIGKAMTELRSGTGLVLVLVTLQ